MGSGGRAGTWRSRLQEDKPGFLKTEEAWIVSEHPPGGRKVKLPGSYPRARSSLAFQGPRAPC